MCTIFPVSLKLSTKTHKSGMIYFYRFLNLENIFLIPSVTKIKYSVFPVFFINKLNLFIVYLLIQAQLNVSHSGFYNFKFFLAF